MKKLLLLSLLFVFTNNIIAQNVGIGTVTPNASAMLDVSSNNKGILIPQISLTGINDITTIPGAINSLLIFNRATAGAGITAVTPGYYYWDLVAATWIRFTAANSIPTGWLLNGNSGTVLATDFIGTTDNQSLQFKIFNTPAGYLGTRGNTYWGLNSGNVNSTGVSNVAIGSAALSQTTNRSNLVAVGDSALMNNGTGATQIFEAVGNTAIGSKTLYANTKGFFNTAVGLKSLYSNTNGNYNTANGVQALFADTSGSSNTGMGYQALTNNTNGSNNTAAGFQSLLSNNTGAIILLMVQVRLPSIQPERIIQPMATWPCFPTLQVTVM
jgi:trimeric autotransporter adhesin